MQRGRPFGTNLELFEKLIDDYIDSPKFEAFGDKTQKWMRRALGLAARVLGPLPTTEIDSAYVQACLEGFSARPGTQYQVRKALRMLEKWATLHRRLTRPITYGTEIIGLHGAREPWTEQEVAIAVEHVGHELAKAIQLTSWTGQRLGDICRMRWDHLRTVKGHLGIDIVQQKTKRKVWAPILQEFEPIFLSWERTALTILTNTAGTPWVQSTLSTLWWRARSGKPALADLHARKLSLHGLRATAVIRLRLDGLTNAQIGAIVGMSEPIVNVYCRRADQDAEAIRAMELRARNARIIPFKKPS
jgi:integrase